ncbi:MAG TPA: FAD-binding oxidoreductase, partial [Telluria sp.]
MHPPRRAFLAQALVAAGVLAPGLPLAAAAGIFIANVTGLYTVKVARAVAPTSSAEVAREVLDWRGKVAVGGGRYSMGGQVAITGGLHLDMRGMNRLVYLDAAAKVARVQAGMRWRDLQEILDRRGLSVKTMQSYANFTAGGTVSVNGHGRYVGNGPIGNSVRALQIVLADGAVVEASRTRNYDLFRAAIGGYGAVGVITEVELDLADNTRIERFVEQ